jgi:hypothetical protein
MPLVLRKNPDSWNTKSEYPPAIAELVDAQACAHYFAKVMQINRLWKSDGGQVEIRNNFEFQMIK